MYKSSISILLILLFTTSICQNKSDIKDQKVLKLVISLNAFHNAKTQDAHAIAEILANHIKKSNNLKQEFIVETPNTYDEIEKSAVDYDCMILTTEEYIHFQKKLSLEPFITNYTAGKVGYKYHLLVNKSDNISDISQLKNETLYILATENQRAPFLWLENLLKEKGISNSKKYFKNIVTEYKATNVVLPVFFNKAKACIVTESALNLLVELNPSLNSNMKTIESSDFVLLGVGCLNSKKKDTDTHKILKEIMLSLHENEYGRQLLHLFNADKLVPYKDEYLQNYLRLTK
jgi:ABC-type phosphate/phosphonate transport system substrate-binding protein